MKRSKWFYLTHPGVTLPALWAKISDKYAIEQKWNAIMDYPLDLDNPQTFNEKLQWLKLHDHNKLYHKLVDKYEVKQWVSDKIGEEYVVRTYSIYNSVDEINFDALPKSFVLKCTHDSGGTIICKNKDTLNRDEAIQKLLKCLSIRDYYKCNREWAYKGVKPRIIAEELLEDNTYDDLVNYKFWCFNGEPQIMYITVKNEDIWENFYDMDFRPLDISHGFRKYNGIINKPKTFKKMKEIARKLSSNIPHVRIDLYEVKGRIYFSEYTFYDWAGFKQIKPYEWDFKIGTLLNLPI